MPFGLKNAPVFFQRVIANLLRKHDMAKFALSYVDNIVLFSKTYDKHLEHLKRLFEMLKQEDIKLKLSKCQFAKSSVVYLGYQIERERERETPLDYGTVTRWKRYHHRRTSNNYAVSLAKVGFYQRFIAESSATAVSTPCISS